MGRTYMQTGSILFYNWNVLDFREFATSLLYQKLITLLQAHLKNIYKTAKRFHILLTLLSISIKVLLSNNSQMDPRS